MTKLEKISRSALYGSEDESASSDGEISYAPNLEFEEITVDDHVSAHSSVADSIQGGEEEEFAFPLFSGGNASKDDVMKVSLKEVEEEVIVNERPETYYRAIYSETRHKENESISVTFEDIMIEFKAAPIDTHPWKIQSLSDINSKVEKDLQSKKNRREGKRKRQNKAECRERRSEREKQIKRLEREEKKRRFKSMDSKWRGAKPKGKVQKPQQLKPKYRTE